MSTQNAKYGYAITTTPGLIEDGSRALTAQELIDWGAENIKIGYVDPETGEADVAIFESYDAAEKVMNEVTPKGSHPSTFAGLNISDANSACPEAIADGKTVGQFGFKAKQY